MFRYVDNFNKHFMRRFYGMMMEPVNFIMSNTASPKQLSGDFSNRFFNFSNFSGYLAFQKEKADIEIFDSDTSAGNS